MSRNQLSCGELQTIFIKDNAHKKDLSNIVLDKNDEPITDYLHLKVLTGTMFY
jgi:hypothetical protein